jgi:hypothetical protein
MKKRDLRKLRKAKERLRYESQSPLEAVRGREGGAKHDVKTTRR